MEKHFTQIAFRKPVGGLLGNKATFECALLHALVIDSTAVILNFDVDVIAAVVGTQHDIASRRFSRRYAVSTLLDAMCHRVAH